MLEGLCYLIFKTYYKATEIRKCGIGARTGIKMIGQNSLEIDLHIHGQFIFDRNAKSVQ